MVIFANWLLPPTVSVWLGWALTQVLVASALPVRCHRGSRTEEEGAESCRHQRFILMVALV